MHNLKFKIRNSPLRLYYSAKRRFAAKHDQAPSLTTLRSGASLRSTSKPAFTLTEMLVAVAMGAMLIAAAAGVFSLASQAVGSSQANININNQLRVLHSWLDRDFARIRLDGPLFLSPQQRNFGGGFTRIDQMYFLLSGDIPSMLSSERASLAIILYGPDSITNNASLNDPYEWVFTRRGTLIVGDSTSGPDIQQSSFAELLSGSPAAIATWTVAWIKPNFYYDAVLDIYLFSDPNELPTYLLGNVTSFSIVSYYIASTQTVVPVVLGAAVPFAPNAEKPAWIEFEIVMRDSNNQLTEDYVSTYRVNLSSR
jgi:prepilin-type N-terminal cleavage/methylation domain-containing protein